MFQIPGGHVADIDAEIFQTLVREVYKETALSFNPVKASTKPFAYATEKTVKQGEEKVVLQKSSLQLNFVCEVRKGTLRVNPEEHSEGI